MNPMRCCLRAALAGSILALAACATGGAPEAQVTRFHLGGPIARGTVFIEPVNAAQPASLEFRSYANVVADGFRRAGFTPVEARSGAEFVGVLEYGQALRPGSRRSGLSIGLGGGGGSGNFGVGGGVSLPIGESRPGDIAVSSLRVTLRRASDQTTIWEGRASTEARADRPTGSLSGALPLLTDAVFAQFPGPSGATTRYRPGA